MAVSVCTSALYLFALGFHAPAFIFIAAILSGLSDVGFVAISSLKSTHVSEKEQGRIQGAVYGVRALASTLGPLAYSSLYDSTWSSKTVVGQSVPFIVALALYSVTTAVASRLPLRPTERQFDFHTTSMEGPLREELLGSSKTDTIEIEQAQD